MPVRDPAGEASWNDATCACCLLPAAHREFHREEMLGALLAAARPGQRRRAWGKR